MLVCWAKQRERLALFGAMLVCEAASEMRESQSRARHNGLGPRSISLGEEQEGPFYVLSLTRRRSKMQSNEGDERDSEQCGFGMARLRNASAARFTPGAQIGSVATPLEKHGRSKAGKCDKRGLDALRKRDKRERKGMRSDQQALKAERGFHNLSGEKK
jgi:hypothetical protein